MNISNFSRGFAPRGGFDEPITSPRREFSRSMSSENWREAKRTTSSDNREEQDDDEGDWRRAGPRERWSEQLLKSMKKKKKNTSGCMPGEPVQYTCM